MEDIVQGALAGIAIGGFVAVVIEANLIAVKAHLAFSTAWPQKQPGSCPMLSIGHR